MNNYESVIIINPNITDEETKEIIKKISDLINIDGKITNIEELGKKKLAYELQKCKEGYYVVFYYGTNSSNISEIERHLRINEYILKFITVRKDD